MKPAKGRSPPAFLVTWRLFQLQYWHVLFGRGAKIGHRRFFGYAPTRNSGVTRSTKSGAPITRIVTLTIRTREKDVFLLDVMEATVYRCLYVEALLAGFAKVARDLPP